MIRVIIFMMGLLAAISLIIYNFRGVSDEANLNIPYEYVRWIPFMPSIIVNAPQIVFFQGDVRIERKGVKEFARHGSLVRKGDIIHVNGNSQLIIDFGNNSKIKIFNDSIFIVNDVLKNIHDSVDHQYLFSLKKGKVFIAYADCCYEKIVPFRMQTMMATMETKEGQFLLDTGHYGFYTKMAVKSGKVEMYSTEHSKELFVEARDGVLIDEEGRISSTKRHPWVININWSEVTRRINNIERYDEERSDEGKSFKEKMIIKFNNFFSNAKNIFLRMLGAS
jgi:hypothetical protein